MSERYTEDQPKVLDNATGGKLFAGLALYITIVTLIGLYVI